MNDPGLYVIEYADQRTAPFPISKDAYANIWQDSLDHHLAAQMDHVSVREGYRVWHGASHLDDGRMAPVVGEQFDGWNQSTATDGKYKGGDHIPGMNVGGWYDAGDFDLEEPAQLNVIQSLALAYREFNLKYDELTVDETAREVEMHRPDGVPDTVQQVKHGALLILAQFHNIGHAIRGTHEPDLRQYTQVGDGASKTDGRIYDPKLGPNEMKGDYSGKPDDRWIFTTNNSYFQWNAIAALAAAADTLKGWDDALAKDCLETAIKAWKDTTANPTLYPTSSGPDRETPANGVLAASQGVVSGEQGARKPKSISGAATNSAAPAAPPTGLGRGRSFVGMDWAAALELTIATNGAEPYKSRLKELFPQMITPEQMDFNGWKAVRALSYLDARRERSNARSGKNIHGWFGQAAGRDAIRRAPEPRHLGRIGRRGGHGDPNVFPAQDVSGSRGPRIHTSRGQLHSRHAPGIEHFVCSWSRYGLEDEDVQQQSRRQCLHPGRRDSGIHHHQAGFSGVHRRLRIPVV